MQRKSLIININIIIFCVIAIVFLLVYPKRDEIKENITYKNYTDILLIGGNSIFVPVGVKYINGEYQNYRYFAKQTISLETDGNSTYCYNLKITIPEDTSDIIPKNVYITKNDEYFLEEDITTKKGEIIIGDLYKVEANKEKTYDVYYATLETNENIDDYKFNIAVTNCK